MIVDRFYHEACAYRAAHPSILGFNTEDVAALLRKVYADALVAVETSLKNTDDFFESPASPQRTQNVFWRFADGMLGCVRHFLRYCIEELSNRNAGKAPSLRILVPEGKEPNLQA